MGSKNKPSHEIRLGAIRANIWTNENADGSQWYSFTLGRLYKDDQGNWQVAQNYKQNHAPEMSKVIKAVYQWIDEHTITAEARSKLKSLMSDAKAKKHTSPNEAV